MRTNSLSSFLILLILLASSNSTGQILPLQYYTSQNGLLANGVNSLFQDSRSYLWIGTAEGVCVYDGATFTSYRTKDGLTRNHITCITESQISGAIWIGTIGGGVNIFANGSFTTISFDSTAKSKFITALMEDSFGTMWCGTEGGVYSIRNHQVTPFPSEIKSPHAVKIVEAADSTVWIGIDHVLYVYSHDERGTQCIKLVLDKDDIIRCMLADRDGKVWIATRSGQLLQFYKRTLVNQRQLVYSEPWQMIDDDSGNIWICSQNGILKMSKGAEGNIVRYTVENGLPDKPIISGLSDREGNLWFGTPSKGLCKWANKNILTFPISPLPAEHYYHPLAAVDSAGHFWVISGDGLWEIWCDQHGGWRKHLHRMSIQRRKRQLASVALDAQGRLWLGFLDGDIHCYKIQSNHMSPSRLILARNLRNGIDLHLIPRQCFFVDEKNQMWLSLEGIGIVQIDLNGKPKRVATYTLKDGLPSHSIRVIYKDREGNLWFGGYDGGVAVLTAPATRKKSLRKFTMADGLPDDHVRAIHQDREGRIWIGTRDGGLAVYNAGKYRTISINDGLISNTIWSITEDDDARLWLGTALGLQALNKDTYQPLPRRNDLMAGAVHGCGVSSNRLIWMANSESFTIYDFSGIALNLVPPPVYITRLQMNAQTIAHDRVLKFPYHQNTCTVEFTGISLRDEKATRFQYRLLNLSPEWSPLTEQRAVTYANLDPGEYAFEVRAINNDGVVSTKPASINFSILPPFWQRWWFQALAALMLAGILIALHRYRVAKLLEIERTRLRIARDLHDEVGSTLSSISFFAQAIHQEAGEHKINGSGKFLSLISESSSHAKEAISDIIWSIDPSNDDWEKISAKLRRYASDVLESRGIRYEIELPSSCSIDKMDMERRRHFWLLFKEMVMNAVKHAQCTEVKIRLFMDGKLLHLIVQDNGIGIDPVMPTNGNGVQNIRARAQSLRADLDLQSSPAFGTQWEMRFQV